MWTVSRRLAAAAMALSMTLAVAAPATAAPAGVGAKGCANASDAAALHVRSLQTWLVVSSLTCGSVDRYNTFVVTFRPALQEHGDALIGYFRKAYGKAGTDKLNRYVTLLANQASALSLEDRDGFCARSNAIYAEMEAGGISNADLDIYSARTVGLLAEEPKSCLPVGEVVSMN